MNNTYILSSEGAWKILGMVQSYAANNKLDAAKLILRGMIIEKNSKLYRVDSVDIIIKTNYINIGMRDITFNMTDIKSSWSRATCSLSEIANGSCRVIKAIGNATIISESIRRRIGYTGQLDELLGCIVYDGEFGFGYIATVADNSEVYGVQYQYGGLQQLIALKVCEMDTLIYDVRVDDFFELIKRTT